MWVGKVTGNEYLMGFYFFEKSFYTFDIGF